jgi:hypothetical protein
MLNEATIAAFRGSLRGGLIEPSDPSYDAARKVYNGMIDRRPRLIARCAAVADVMTAVKFGPRAEAASGNSWRRTQRGRVGSVR